MRLFLAPMEGVVDYHFRDIVTPLAGVDLCVTEFVRVTQKRMPPRAFRRLCPELDHGSQTRSGTPVRVQILGGNPNAMAESAKVAEGLGAVGIDINFGCPSKGVNKNDGGSILLRETCRLGDIVGAVRQAVSDATPVTAKIRLGYDDRSGYLDNARIIEDAGASELFIHARSKVDGYRPPAYWECISKVREQLDIPVIANGEIWTVDDWQRCKDISGAEDFMIGRGLISMPDLGAQIRATVNETAYQPLVWSDILPMVYRLHLACEHTYGLKNLGNRVKQWLGYLKRNYPEAQQLFKDIRRCHDSDEFALGFAKAFSQAGLTMSSA